MALNDTRLIGVDQFFNSEGALLGPFGFGFQNDWEIIERVVVSSAVASVDLDLNGTGFDPTLYDEYEITALGVTTTADNSLLLRTSTDGGATYDAGASDYSYILTRVSHTTSEFVSRSGDDANTSMIIGDAQGGAANEHMSWWIKCGPLDNGEHKAFDWKGSGRISDANGYSYWGGGQREDTADINGLRLLPSGGSFDAGVFTLRGRRKDPISFTSQDDWTVIIDDESPVAAATHDFFWADNVFDEIEVTLSGVLTGTDDRDIRVRLSSDGSTFHAGASDYESAMHNFNSAAGSSFAESLTAASEAKIAFALGTTADELVDVKLTFQGVSNAARKKKGEFVGSGIVADGTFQNFSGTIIDLNTNDRLQGIQLRGETGATLTWDRCRIRGRRVSTAGQGVADAGDLKHMGDFGVATPGDAFIDVDMRSSVNPAFLVPDFQDTEFVFFLHGFIGPSNATLAFRVMIDGTPQSGASDYKSDNSNSISSIRMTASTPGTGRRIVARGQLYNYNNAASTTFIGVTGESFSADSGGTREPLGFWGGHANALANNTNNGFRVFASAGDMDDITISVYAYKRSAA